MFIQQIADGNAIYEVFFNRIVQHPKIELFIIPNLLECSETVDLLILILASDLPSCWRSELIKAVIWSTSVVIGRPERAAFSISIFS